MFNASLLGNTAVAMATAHHGGHVGHMMGRDHPSCVSVGPLVGELWHLEYFPTWRPSAILNYKKNNIRFRKGHCGPNLLSCTKFHQNWFTRSASRRRQQHNIQYTVARQRTSPWQPHHGAHVGILTGCDHPSFVPIGSLAGELWRFQYFQHGGRPPF